MIELGISARKLRNFSISWNTSAQRALSLDRIGTGSNLIERQLRWLKGQHECRLRTRRTEDFSCSPLTNTSTLPSWSNSETETKTHFSEHLRATCRNLVIFSIAHRGITKRCRIRELYKRRTVLNKSRKFLLKKKKFFFFSLEKKFTSRNILII